MNQQNKNPPIGFIPNNLANILPHQVQANNQSSTNASSGFNPIGFADNYLLPQYRPHQQQSQDQYRPQMTPQYQPSNFYQPQQQRPSYAPQNQFNPPQSTHNNPQNQFIPQAPQYSPHNQFRQQAPQYQNAQIDSYVTRVFNDIDVDKNNCITIPELSNALTRLNNNFTFDQRTIEFILKRFDTNNDRTLTLNEFNNFFIYLNEEYEKFLMADTNGNGFIDDRELFNLLTKRGCLLNPNCIQLIVQNIGKQISFDLFCRVSARFDYLCKTYVPSRHGPSIDNFVSQTFFQEF